MNALPIAVGDDLPNGIPKLTLFLECFQSLGSFVCHRFSNRRFQNRTVLFVKRLIDGQSFPVCANPRDLLAGVFRAHIEGASIRIERLREPHKRNQFHHIFFRLHGITPGFERLIAAEARTVERAIAIAAGQEEIRLQLLAGKPDKLIVHEFQMPYLPVASAI